MNLSVNVKSSQTLHILHHYKRASPTNRCPSDAPATIFHEKITLHNNSSWHRKSFSTGYCVSTKAMFSYEFHEYLILFKSSFLCWVPRITSRLMWIHMDISDLIKKCFLWISRQYDNYQMSYTKKYIIVFYATKWLNQRFIFIQSLGDRIDMWIHVTHESGVSTKEKRQEKSFGSQRLLCDGNLLETLFDR